MGESRFDPELAHRTSLRTMAWAGVPVYTWAMYGPCTHAEYLRLQPSVDGFHLRLRIHVALLSATRTS